MVFHMKRKTTLSIDEQIMRRLKQEAARRGTTLSELVETALRRLLETPEGRGRQRALPSFDGGRCLVDVTDRDALYRTMDGT